MVYRSLKILITLVRDSSSIKQVLQQSQTKYNILLINYKLLWSDTMKIITAEQYQSETKEQTTDLLGEKELDDAVLPIIQQVKTDGDTALRSLTEKFDQVKLDQLLVSSEEI